MDELIAKQFSSIMSITPEEWAEKETEMKNKERRIAEQRRHELYIKRVPERYWKESIDTYTADTQEQQDAKKAAQDFIQNVKCGAFRTLLFLGHAGTGKTHLACAMIRECGGFYKTSPKIVEELRNAKSFTAKETEAEILDRYAHTPLFVIDEIGRGISSADEQYMIYQIINGRYETRKPTVLISNQSKKDFINYIGIAAADRLTESAQTVEFTGVSYRATLRHAM